MRKERLETIRKRLIDLREDLLTEIRRHNAEAADLVDEGVPDVADQGLTDNLKELLHLLGDGKREELIKLDEAIDRLGRGAYGVCQGCLGDIDIARLEVRPYTRYCIACKQKEEEESRQKTPGTGQL